VPLAVGQRQEKPEDEVFQGQERARVGLHSG
jgi:hypothetical protein